MAKIKKSHNFHKTLSNPRSILFLCFCYTFCSVFCTHAATRSRCPNSSLFIL